MKAFNLQIRQIFILLLIVIAPQFLTAQSFFTKSKTFLKDKANGIYLFAGMDLAKQNISAGNYSSAFNYNLTNYNNNTFNIINETYQKYNCWFTYGNATGKFCENNNYQAPFSLSPPFL